MAWHLEDPDGETIDEDYSDPKAVEAFTLLSDPMGALDVKEVGTKLTRRQEWEITSRHMGLAGCGAWFLDRLNDFGIPLSICYVRPDRLTPQYEGKTKLTGWLLDRRPGFEGTPLTIDEIRLFVLETPNEGVFPPGLVESALTKALLNGAVDQHFAAVLKAGGRLAGILAPKTGIIEDDGVYNQMTRDWRNITEQPESARRLQVTRAPVDFIRTAATMAEMQVIDLMTKNRDDLLALWGVPLSQVGGSTAAGLNSGDVRKYDEAALWQNAVHPRLEELAEGIQPLLDRWTPYMGWAPTLVLEEPEFDDDSPRYDKVQKAQFIALTNDERRDLIGQPPLDEKVIGPTGQPIGQEIWMGINMMPVGKPPMVAPTVTAKQIQAPAWSEEAGDIQQVPSGAQQGATGPMPVTGAAVKAKGPDVTEAVLGQLRKQWKPADLALVGKGDWKYDPGFPMKKVNAARRPIARNPTIVAGKEAALNIGAPIPPIVLVHTKVIGKPGYEPIDGWHGAKAAENAGLKKIPAYVGEGDPDWTTAIIAVDDTIPTPPSGPGKAAPVHLAGYQASMRTLKDNLTARVSPQLRAAVSLVLDQQKRDIVSRVRTNFDTIASHPKDASIWWPPSSKWDDAMTAALRPALLGAAEQVDAHIQATVLAGRKAGPVKKPPVKKPGVVTGVLTDLADIAATQAAGSLGLYSAGAVQTVLTKGAARVTGINATTKDMIQKLVADGIEKGMSPAELGDSIEAASGFDEYRAELIARTELGTAYNAAALGSYGENGIEMIQVLDGDQDDICAPWADVTVPIDEAPDELGHPNCTRDFLPVIGSAEDYGKAGIVRESVRADKAAEFLRAIQEDETASRQELVGMVGKFADAMKAQASQPVTVNYTPPDIHVPAPVVNVAAPIVNVAAPEVKATHKVVKRDDDGNIIEVREETT